MHFLSDAFTALRQSENTYEKENRMAKLIPDSIYNILDLTVNVKKIPFGTKWNKNCCGFKKGDLYKADRLMTDGTGKILGITIHNTGNGADAETYTRATFNQNMNTSRVHFYVDTKEAWQNLEENEVGWHAGTGDRSLGNDSYLAIEIIMGSEKGESDRKAEENGALLTAHLLLKYGLSLSDVVTHKHWSGKNCPKYILPHWDSFLSLVSEKYAALKSAQASDSEQDSVSTKTVDNTPDDYAKYSVYKAVQNKILVGDTSGDLRLHDFVTRQDLCVILDRMNIMG